MTDKESSTWKRGRDIWIRSRTNAFANELASKRFTLKANFVFIIQAFFVVIPIVAVGLSLHLITIGTDSGPVNITSYFNLFAIVTIISNGIAFFLNMITTQLKWNELSFRHNELLSGYSYVAQQARKIDDEELPADQAKILADQLHELFVSLKNKGLEPDDRFFKKAHGLLETLNVYPFGLNQERLKQLK